MPSLEELLDLSTDIASAIKDPTARARVFRKIRHLFDEPRCGHGDGTCDGEAVAYCEACGVHHCAKHLEGSRYGFALLCVSCAEGVDADLERLHAGEYDGPKWGDQ